MSMIYSTDSSWVKSSRCCIYIGGKNDAKNRDWLERVGITHILNVTPPKESGIKAGVPNYFESSGRFKYKRIPVYDASTSDLVAHATAVVTFIATALIHGSILVHCQHGVSRSPTCVAFYLMSRRGMRWEAAMDLLKAKRPIINPIPAFLKQLQDYERVCGESSDFEKIGSKRKREIDGAISTKGQNTSASIGPAIQSTAHSDVDTSKLVKVGPSIGPSLPPFQKTGNECSYDRDEGNGSSVNGPLTPFQTKVVHDLSLPAQRQTKLDRKVIGPMMPPCTKKM